MNNNKQCSSSSIFSSSVFFLRFVVGVVSALCQIDVTTFGVMIMKVKKKRNGQQQNSHTLTKKRVNIENNEKNQIKWGKVANIHRIIRHMWCNVYVFFQQLLCVFLSWIVYRWICMMWEREREATSLYLQTQKYHRTTTIKLWTLSSSSFFGRQCAVHYGVFRNLIDQFEFGYFVFFR